MTQPKREPSQRARDAAADLFAETTAGGKPCMDYRRGRKDDDPIVQAFAKFEAETPVPNQLRGEGERSCPECGGSVFGRHETDGAGQPVCQSGKAEIEAALSSPSVEAGAKGAEKNGLDIVEPIAALKSPSPAGEVLERAAKALEPFANADVEGMRKVGDDCPSDELDAVLHLGTLQIKHFRHAGEVFRSLSSGGA